MSNFLFFLFSTLITSTTFTLFHIAAHHDNRKDYRELKKAYEMLRRKQNETKNKI